MQAQRSHFAGSARSVNQKCIIVPRPAAAPRGKVALTVTPLKMVCGATALSTDIPALSSLPEAINGPLVVPKLVSNDSITSLEGQLAALEARLVTANADYHDTWEKLFARREAEARACYALKDGAISRHKLNWVGPDIRIAHTWLFGQKGPHDGVKAINMMLEDIEARHPEYDIDVMPEPGYFLQGTDCRVRPGPSLLRVLRQLAADSQELASKFPSSAAAADAELRCSALLDRTQKMLHGFSLLTQGSVPMRLFYTK